MVGDKVLVVTGSRHWVERRQVELHLAALPGRWLIVHGDAAHGLDRMAGEVGRELGHFVRTCPVDTSVDGPWPTAGFNRNERMLDTWLPVYVLGFRAGGKSSGTDHCLKQAKRRRIYFRVVLENGMVI